MNKRILSCFVITTLLTGILFTACGTSDSVKQNDTGSKETTAAPAPEKTQAAAEETKADLKADISMWVYPHIDKEDVFYNEKVNAEFKAAYPGIDMTTETIPWDGGPNKVNVAIASGSTPDILLDTPMRINGYAAKGVLVPLDDSIEKVRDLFYPNMLNAGLVDGKRYVMPAFISSGYALAVNTSLAKELGVYDMLPKDFVSWSQEDFKKFVAAATEKGKAKGIYGTSLWAGSQSSDAVYFSWLMSAGGQVFDDSMKKIILNSPEAAKGLDILASMVKEKIVTPGAPTLKDEDMDTLFFNKKTVVDFTASLWTV